MHKIISKQFSFFFGLTVLDRGLNFILPLLVLYFYSNHAAFNLIEYISSLAAFIFPYAELGSSGYMLYEKKGELLDESKFRIKKYRALLSLKLALILVVFVAIALVSKSYLVCFAVCSRIMYQSIAGFYRMRFILLERRNLAQLVSIGISLGCLLVVASLLWTASDYIVSGYYIVYFASGLVVLLSFSGLKGQWGRALRTVWPMLKFTWPLLTSTFIMLLVQNFSKIFIFHNFSSVEMTEFSLAQKFSYALILIHVSISVYLQKHLISCSYAAFVATIRKYAALLLVFSFLIVLAVRFFVPGIPLFIFSLLILSSLFWCVLAILEIFYNRNDKTIVVLLLSAFQAAVFFSGLIFLHKHLIDFSILLSGSALMTLVLSLILIRRGMQSYF